MVRHDLLVLLFFIYRSTLSIDGRKPDQDQAVSAAAFLPACRPNVDPCAIPPM
jgi:hypothetical protein